MTSARDSLGDDLPVVEHDDAIGERHDGAHDMLDEDDRARPGRGSRGSAATASLISVGVRPDRTSSSSTSRGRDASARASSRNLR